ncbi:MAG: hypothetical protein KC414_14915, partial [Romboutsia sp.]|nr:hypothetical protein [Romboutsia sp.]
ADKSIMNDGDLLPKNTSILRVTYDSDKELVRKYDVSVQHTFVLVDKTGKEIKKWTGGNIDTILSNL